MNKFAIVGGCNVDYIAVSNEKLISKASNVGTISSSFGGVGRNIAENLANLGNDVTMFTAIGKDFCGESLKKYMETLGVKMNLSDSELSTGTYMVINDNDHDIVAAICDNRIISAISPDYIRSIFPKLNEFEFIGIDANLDQATIDYLFANLKDKKIFVDTISPEKAKKFNNYLDKIYLLKCNLKEAKSLASNDNGTPKEVCEELVKLGMKNLVISNGPEDIYFADLSGEVKSLKVEKVTKFINTTGCGDTLTSGLIHELAKGQNLEKSLSFAAILAKLTLFSASSCSAEVRRYKD